MLTIYNAASGVASVAYKDVMGKTITKGKRGQLLALRSTVGGVFPLVSGYILYRYVDGSDNLNVYVVLIGIAGLLWFASAVFFFRIPETEGATDGGRSPIRELNMGMALLGKDSNLRTFITARSLLMAVPFSQPFLILRGKDIVGSDLDNLGIMIIAAGIAGIVSSPFWGRFADYSSRKLMIAIGLLGALTLGAALAFPQLPGTWQTTYAYALIIVLQVMAHGGARLSRKTYLVDMAPSEERPLYVALSNTLIGLATLIFIALGVIADLFSIEAMLFTLLALCVIRSIASFFLRDI